MPKLITSAVGAMRRVQCTQCGQESEVAKRAMSVFCPHCKERVILENYTVKSYHASRLFATCGDIIVEKSGIVSAIIRVQNLTIKGQVQGHVEARGSVHIAKTGKVRGDIQAPRLSVADGAVINGFIRITPEMVADTGGLTR